MPSSTAGCILRCNRASLWQPYQLLLRPWWARSARGCSYFRRHAIGCIMSCVGAQQLHLHNIGLWAQTSSQIDVVHGGDLGAKGAITRYQCGGAPSQRCMCILNAVDLSCHLSAWPSMSICTVVCGSTLPNEASSGRLSIRPVTPFDAHGCGHALGLHGSSLVLCSQLWFHAPRNMHALPATSTSYLTRALGGTAPRTGYAVSSDLGAAFGWLCFRARPANKQGAKP